MKKYSVFKAISLTIFFVCICTWIFSSITFSGQLIDTGTKTRIGYFDLFAYVVEVIRYFPYIALLTLSFAVFYGVLYRIPAYRALLDKIVNGFKGKEIIFLVTVIVLISGLVSISGFPLGMLFIFPFIISIVLLMGYNKLVAASVTVGSVCVGLVGTTIGTRTSYYFDYFLGTSYSDKIVFKIIMLLIGIVVLAINVIEYAKKTRNEIDGVYECVPSNRNNNKVKEVIAEEVKDNKSKTSKKDNKTKANVKTSEVKVVKKSKKPFLIPLIVLFDLTFLFILAAEFDWSIFNATWPKTVLEAFRDFSVKGIDFFNRVFGASAFEKELGAWDINFQMPAAIFLSTMLVAFIYGVKVDKFIEGVLDGLRRAIKPVFYMMLVYLVLVIVSYHPFQLHFVQFFVELSKNFNVFTVSIAAMISSFFNVESVYVAQSSLPYISSHFTDASLYPVISIIYQGMYGLVMLIAPTSVVLVGTLVYLDIPYTQWLKHIWKVFIELLILLIFVFLIVFLT